MNMYNGIAKVIGVSALFCAMLFSGAPTWAQEEPTTTWPYIYQDFMEGEVYLTTQHKIQSKLNVHLAHSKVHYLESGIIKELRLNDVVAVIIGADRYVPYGDAMYKVVASTEKGLILQQSVGDFAALQETGGAYGSSSASSATMRLSSIESASVLGQNHMLVLQSKHNGKILPLITKYYVQTPDFMVGASKKNLDQMFYESASEWKAWLKSHKIKWNNPESLAQILDFLK